MPPEFGSLEKGQSMISAYRSLGITTNTPSFKKLFMAMYEKKNHTNLLRVHLKFYIVLCCTTTSRLDCHIMLLDLNCIYERFYEM